MAVSLPPPKSEENIVFPSKKESFDEISISHHEVDDTTTLCTIEKDNLLPLSKQSRNFSFSKHNEECKHHEIFGTALGTILNEYPCYNAIHNGVLYTGTKAIGFFSNKVFGYERRIEIPLENITDLIRLERMQDICIKTNSVNHTFKEFKNRDVVLTEIYDLAASNGRGGYATAQRNLKLISNMAELQANESKLNLKKSSENQKSENNDVHSHKSKAALSVIASMASLDPEKVIPIYPECLGKHKMIDQAKHELGKKEQINKKNGVEEKWRHVKFVQFDSLKDTAIKNIKLSCSVKDVFANFFANNAKNSIEKFQSEKIGDFDLETTPWISSTLNDTQTRIIRYKHPMNIPMAPPSARATKEQTLHHMSLYGICISTCTTSYDAPTTDCFTVQDTILVEADGEGVSVTIKFEVRFVKHTLFRTFVELTTRKEFKKWFKGFTHMMVKVINEDQLLLDDGTGDGSTTSEDTNDKSDTINNQIESSPKWILHQPLFDSSFFSSNALMTTIVLLVVLAQAGMMYQLFYYQKSLMSTEDSIKKFISSNQMQTSEILSMIVELQDQLKESSSQICDAFCS